MKEITTAELANQLNTNNLEGKITFTGKVKVNIIIRNTGTLDLDFDTVTLEKSPRNQYTILAEGFRMVVGIEFAKTFKNNNNTIELLPRGYAGFYLQAERIYQEVQ
jgi:lipopolysaccharide export system protein LptA